LFYAVRKRELEASGSFTIASQIVKEWQRANCPRTDKGVRESDACEGLRK
jgi:hypothetical protein